MRGSSLKNMDLFPINQSQRNWGFFTYFLLWAGLIIQIPTYTLIVALLEMGMSLQFALFSILFGSSLILVPIILCSDPGYRYGISYPVFVRSVLGIKGSKISGYLRIIIACGWFGIQTWIGASVIFYIATFLFPVLLSYSNWLRYACFFSFLFFNSIIVYKGALWIKKTENICSFFLILSLCSLLLLLYNEDVFHFPISNGIFAKEFKILNLSAFFSSVVIVAGFWSTLSVNMSDFTRYAKSSYSHIAGQISGVILFMIGFSYLSLIALNKFDLDKNLATDPLYILENLETIPLKISVSIFILIATLTTNIAANLVGAANEISNLLPRYISFKRGVILASCLGTFMMPWYFLENNSRYLFVWLSGYASLLGPLTGIILVDYFIIKKKKLIVEELFKNDGEYSYENGYNLRAVFALSISIAINIPGFMVNVGLCNSSYFPSLFLMSYGYAWFTGLLIAAILYYYFCLIDNMRFLRLLSRLLHKISIVKKFF